MSVLLKEDKLYLTTLAIGKARPPIYSITKIVGKVIPGTIEYIEGARYFCNRSVYYDEKGKALFASIRISDSLEKRCIIEEAKDDDLIECIFERYQIDLLECSTSPNYIDRFDSEFEMKMGGLYIDRRGFSIHIDRMIQYENGWVDYMSYASKGNFGLNGRIYQKQSEPSMEDLMFQRKL